MNRPLPTALGWNLPDWLLDFGPVALIVLIGAASVGLRPHDAGVPSAILWLALTVNGIALLVRHRAPLISLAAVVAIAFGVDYGPVVMLSTMFALFTVAEYRDRRTVVAAAVVCAAVVILAQPVHSHAEAFTAVLSRLVAVGLAVALGLYLRARADYVAGLRERAEQADREHELLAIKAVGEERVRIARELHDVVAHNVSLMVVQAQALEATSAHDSEQQAALRRLAGWGREALSEMHRMLGVLRLEEGAGAERRPQPGVRDLAALVERTAQAGVQTELTVEGEPCELSPGVDLSAFRIVQEALTNVIRHARAEHVAVTLSYLPGALRVTVTDDGAGPGRGSNGASAGHGLVGMRERVALFGGRLETGALADRSGYRVDALLPTG